MPHSKGRFASKSADFNNDMNVIVAYLNDPANTSLQRLLASLQRLLAS